MELKGTVECPAHVTVWARAPLDTVWARGRDRVGAGFEARDAVGGEVGLGGGRGLLASGGNRGGRGRWGGGEGGSTGVKVVPVILAKLRVARVGVRCQRHDVSEGLAVPVVVIPPELRVRGVWVRVRVRARLGGWGWGSGWGSGYRVRAPGSWRRHRSYDPLRSNQCRSSALAGKGTTASRSRP